VAVTLSPNPEPKNNLKGKKNFFVLFVAIDQLPKAHQNSTQNSEGLGTVLLKRE